MPSFERPGRDMPNRRDIEDSQRRDQERNRMASDELDRVERYLRNHPDASYAEAEYKTRR